MSSHSTRAADGSRGLALAITAAILWGTVGITTRALYDTTQTNPLSIGFFRLALATPILAALCWRALGPQSLRIARRDAWLMVLAGAMLGLSQVCYFTAISYAGVAIATLITQCTAPVLVTLISATITREKLAPATLLALVCALAGTGLLVGRGSGSGTAGGTTLAALFALGSAVCYSIFTVCSRHLSQRYHPLQSTTVGFAVGAALLLGLASISGFATHYSLEGWGLLLYLGIVPSALAYFLFLTGMKSISATLASITTLMEPLTATLLAWALFGETLGGLGIVGAALLLVAIGILFRGESRLREARE